MRLHPDNTTVDFYIPLSQHANDGSRTHLGGAEALVEFDEGDLVRLVHHEVLAHLLQLLRHALELVLVLYRSLQ